MQPVHFISRTKTETKKRYSQTEKDALAIKWAKKRLRVYLLGAPRLRIATAHKPLLPSFNKAKATMPHKMEKGGLWKCRTLTMRWCNSPEKTKQTPRLPIQAPTT